MINFGIVPADFGSNTKTTKLVHVFLKNKDRNSILKRIQNVIRKSRFYNVPAHYEIAANTEYIMLGFIIMRNYMPILLILLFPGLVFASEKDCNKDIVTFHECNNPIVMKYLALLSEKDIGKELKGLELTDKTLILQGYKFLGKSLKVDSSIHLYLFKHRDQIKAFAWIESGGKELAIPGCPKDVSFENAYVLTGDVYTLCSSLSFFKFLYWESIITG